MKRKGILLPNTLSIFIAVLGLVIVFYAAYQLYTISNTNQELENGRTLAEVLKAKIESIKSGHQSNITIRGPGDDWFLAVWGKNEFPKPDKCFFEGCICVYKGSFLEDFGQKRIDNCQKGGVSPREIIADRMIIHSSYQEISGFGSNKIERNSAIIPLKNKLAKLEITKGVLENGESFVRIVYDPENLFNFAFDERIEFGIAIDESIGEGGEFGGGGQTTTF